MCQRSRAQPKTPLRAQQGRSRSEKTSRWRGLLLSGSTGRGAAATCMAAAAVLLPSTGPLTAQPSDNPLADLLHARTQVRTPTADEAMGGYLAVNAWVRDWQQPDAAGCPAAAVRVALYQRGRPVGWGVSLAEQAGESGPLQAAAAQALAMAERELLPSPDALAAERLRALAEDLTVSVEFAGAFTPMTEAALASPDATIRPGLDGLAVRVKGEWLTAFPGEPAPAGISAGVRLSAMAARLLGDPTLGLEPPIDLAGGRGVVFYRFEVLRVAGVGTRRSPVFVTRGGSIVEAGEVTTNALAEFLGEMVDHLAATRIGADARLGLMGPLHAARGVADGVATPMQQSLAALALLRAAEVDALPLETRDRARALARQTMADLAVVEPPEVAVEAGGVAAAVAWVVLRQLDAEHDESLAALFASCARMLADHAAADRRGMTPGVSDAILAWALAERAAATGLDAEAAERETRAIFLAAEPGGLVGLMPWLAWAELRLAGEGPVPAGAVLRQVRAQAWDHQLGTRDTGLAEADLAGGVVFTNAAVGLPTWATARPAAMCATMLGDPRLTTAEEAPGETVRMIGAMRFLRQLSAREVECAFYPRPDLARGGVRAAVWDHTMPPEATAMTMLAVCEFLGAMDALQARKEQPATSDSR